MSYRSARALPRWATPAIAAVVALAWFAGLGWHAADASRALDDPGVVYQLHRVSRCLLDFPHVTSLDTYAHAATPSRIPWPGPTTWLLALVAKMRGAPATDLLAIAQSLALVPAILGAFAAAFTVLLARACGLREATAGLAGLGCALSGDSVLAFHAGLVENHAFTALLLVVLAWGWLARRLVAWILGATLLAATSPDAVLALSLLLLVVIGCEGAGAALATRDRLRRPAAWFFAPAVAAVAAWLLDRALDPDALPWSRLSVDGLSPLQIGWLLLLGAAGAAAATLPRRGRTRMERFSALAGIVLGASAILALGLLLSGLLNPLLDGILPDRVVTGDDEVSPLAILPLAPLSPRASWAVVVLLVALAAFGRTLVLIHRREAPRRIEAALVLLGAALFSLAEIRTARCVAPIAAIALVAACADAAAVIGSSTRVPRALARAIVAWMIVVVAPPFLWHAAATRRAQRTPPRWTIAVGPLCEWMREHLPDAGPRDRPPRSGVLAPWEWGAHVNALGRQPALVDAFNRESASGATDAWLAETGDELADDARRAGATHVLATSAAPTLAALLPPGEETIHERRDAPGRIAWVPGLRRSAAFRLDEAGGLEDSSGRLMPLWASPVLAEMATLEIDGRLTVSRFPSARLFEIVPGAIIEGDAPPGTVQLVFETPLRLGDGPEQRLVRLVPVDGAGHFRFRTALPAPWTSGPITIPGPHRLRGPSTETVIVLAAQGVRAGTTFTVAPTSFGPAGEVR